MRVAAKRREGKLLRQTADEEDVSLGQAQRDLKAASVSGDTVDPDEGKIKGRDGKVRKATQFNYKASSAALPGYFIRLFESVRLCREMVPEFSTALNQITWKRITRLRQNLDLLTSLAADLKMAAVHSRN